MKTIKIILPVLLIAIGGLLLCSCQGQPQDDSYVRASVDQFEEMMEDEPGLLVDVRTPAEFEAGHLEGAINIDYYEEDFAEELNKLDKSQTLYIYCGSGNRSGKASNMLLQEEERFPKIVDMDGGITDWEAKDKPTVK